MFRYMCIYVSNICVYHVYKLVLFKVHTHTDSCSESLLFQLVLNAILPCLPEFHAQLGFLKACFELNLPMHVNIACGEYLQFGLLLYTACTCSKSSGSSWTVTARTWFTASPPREVVDLKWPLSVTPG